jgi:ribonuclease P protein component
VKPGRIVRREDFERVLAVAPRARSAHFALHHLADAPGPGRRELSTGEAPMAEPAVDDSREMLPPPGRWLGIVVPKRHARRAVTRNLVKRAVRAAGAVQGERLPAGLWIVRLRAPIATATFPSAASPALRRMVAGELAELFGRACRSS